jgi:hypothetical protein
LTFRRVRNHDKIAVSTATDSRLLRLLRLLRPICGLFAAYLPFLIVVVTRFAVVRNARFFVVVVALALTRVLALVVALGFSANCFGNVVVGRDPATVTGAAVVDGVDGFDGVD